MKMTCCRVVIESLLHLLVVGVAELRVAPSALVMEPDLIVVLTRRKGSFRRGPHHRDVARHHREEVEGMETVDVDVDVEAGHEERSSSLVYYHDGHNDICT